MQLLAIHPQAPATAGFSLEQLAWLAYVGNGRPDFISIEIYGAYVSLLHEIQLDKLKSSCISYNILKTAPHISTNFDSY